MVIDLGAMALVELYVASADRLLWRCSAASDSDDRARFAEHSLLPLFFSWNRPVFSHIDPDRKAFAARLRFLSDLK